MMTRALLILVGIVLGGAAFVDARESADVVRVRTELSQRPVFPGELVRIAVVLEIARGWHINAHEPTSQFLIPTVVSFDEHPSIAVDFPRYPEPIERRFKFLKETLDLYEGTVPILADARVADFVAPDDVSLGGRVSVQACNHELCLTPSEMPFTVVVPVGMPGESVVRNESMIFSQGLPAHDTIITVAPPMADWFLRGSPLLWFLAALLGGFALNLTPCVYPMIPVTIAFFGNQAAGRGAHYTARLGMLYVLGLALSYAALGTLAAQTGALLGSWLQQPAVILFVAGVIVALSLSLFGLYELRVPSALMQRFGRASAGSLGALVMGMTIGIVAAPCVGPFMLGLLIFVGQLGDPLLGFFLFLMVGIGMGIPYIGLAVAAERLVRLPKAGVWMVWVKRALGVVLLGVAFWFIRPLLPAHVQPGGDIAWEPYSPARFEQAVQSERPILIDMYADWCVPCVELDHVTFRHPDVVEALAGFTTLRLDVTLEVPEEAQPLLDRYGVYGVPTVLIFDAGGRERADLRADGFVEPEEFVERLRRVRRE